MALNSPPLKLYDCASFALDDINEFAKGQGYAVLKFRLKTDKQIAKLVYILPHKSLRNPINQLRSI
jgi:hypothetical protein